MRRCRFSLLVPTTITALVTCLTGGCGTSVTVLTFDELPLQPVDGLTVQGLTFGYQNGSFANYNGFSGPIDAQFLERPCLDGDASGILTLDFDKPTPTLKFGVALRHGNPLTPGLTIELFDADLMSLRVLPIDTEPLISFTEAKFVHTGIPVRRAVLDFDETASAFFHLDNLAFVR